MKRDKRFDLVNELSKAVMDKTVYEHTLGTGDDDTGAFKMNASGPKVSKEEQKKQKQKEEQEILEKLYAQRKSGR